MSTSLEPEQLLPGVRHQRRPVLAIEGLEQRLSDCDRPEEFVVYVRQAITICEGDFVALLGPSGCGKTTLLTVLGLLRAPTDARGLDRFSIWIGHGEDRKEVDLRQAWLTRNHGRIERLRREHLGFALQSGELLPALNVRENIATPLRLNGIGGRQCRQRVEELLEKFGLRRPALGHDRSHGQDGEALPAQHRAVDLGYARVNKLSGGEYQRVALARAIAHRPRIAFVDEPTAALNRELARGALAQLRLAQQQSGSQGATIMITHDEQLADEFANVVIRMAPLPGRPAGAVVEVVCREAPSSLSRIRLPILSCPEDSLPS